MKKRENMPIAYADTLEINVIMLFTAEAGMKCIACQNIINNG